MSNIRKYAVNYVSGLQQLLMQVEVTDVKRSLSFAKGVEVAVGMIRKLKATGNKVILIGNGASAAIASHQAADFLRASQVRACAFNDAPMITCLGNDLGFERTFDYSIGLMAEPDDLLICISCSGASVNILNGARKGSEIGCRIITLSGFDSHNPLRKMGCLNFYVPSSGYGKVEVIHLSVLHCINDFLAGR